MIQIGNDKIKDIYVGSDKIKEVYHGSQLVYGSSFNGILYDNGFEGVEWEMGINTGTTANSLLDKSQNVLHAQVMSTGTGQEVSWITKDPIDISKYNNLKIKYDVYISYSGRARVGVFLGTVKNQTIVMNSRDYPTYFEEFIFYNYGNTTDHVLNIPFTSSSNLYISTNVFKNSTSSGTGYIKIKEMILELLPIVLFDADNTINLGFEEGNSYPVYYTQISENALHLSTSDSWGSATVVSSVAYKVDNFTKLRVTWDAPSNQGLLRFYLADNKTDGSYGRPYEELYGNHQGRQTSEMDISAQTGNKYILMVAYGDVSSNFNIYKVELIP